MSRRFAAAALVLLGTALLAGCTPTVHLEPAADANNPLCASVTVRLQNAGSIADLDRRWTDAQATGAWGEDGKPSAIIMRCGVEVPAPTSELQCVTLEGVDWLVDPSESPFVRLTTYGRDPAVQLYINTGDISSNDVISNRAIVSAVTAVPAERRCTTPDELDDEIQDELLG